jgi:Ser/Thr protein kinase RdoA (MazF antagonist)
MAVFTEVSQDDAGELVRTLALGELRELRGIQGGIENTNYFLTTDGGEYVLTLFERLTFEQLPFYLHLMKHLAQRGIPVPEPQPLPSSASKDNPDVNVLRIPFVGERTATILAEHFGSMDTIMQADMDTLQEAEEVGPKVAHSIQRFFELAQNREEARPWRSSSAAQARTGCASGWRS